MSTTTLTRRARPTAARIGSLALEHGGSIDDVKVAYEVYGRADTPVVLVIGGISAGRHLLPTSSDSRDGWWSGVVGDGCALDPARFRLIGIDYVGGRGASSHPTEADPWPEISTNDQAAAIVALLDHLEIDALHAIVGASYGGMVALALAARFPDRVQRVITVGAAARPHPLATAIRSVQRRVLRFGIEQGRPQEGVAIARALAITTYRTSTEFAGRFSGPAQVTGDTARFPVDDYLDRHARRYADFDAQSFLTLSGSIDLHDVDASRIRARCSLASIDSDTLVPTSDVRALATALGDRATFACIPSAFGHDGFLKEASAVSSFIGGALRDTAVASAAVAGSPPPLAADGSPVTSYAGRARTSDTRSLATAAVRAGIGSDAQHGAVIAPIHLSSTFSFDGYGKKRAYDYTRSGNPTRDVLASTIADLEGAAAGIVTATGMAAVAVTLNLLKPGELLIAAHDGYGGTYRLLRALARKHAFDVAFVDLTQPSACEIIRTRRPRMVWIETPSNPLLRVTDIAAVSAAAHAAGAICVADNTFLSPALQNPIAHGADIVLHSTTKYLNGHSDVVGGAIVATDVAVAEELGWWANCTGATGAPFDSYLTLRGIRTLHARIRSHLENTDVIIDLLTSHDAVSAVHYPGLRSHRGHEIARRQQRGFGAMASFELANGPEAIQPFVEGLRCFSLAESLGGVESLVAHPATMTHAAMDAEARRNAGISDALLRLSIGIEDPDDLRADLSAALDRALR